MSNSPLKTLAEREASLLAGEQDLERRTAAADLRDEVLEGREERMSARVTQSVLSEARLRATNERLVVATVNAQARVEDAEEATAQMSHLAEHDFLTGLPNRALLADRLAQSISLAGRHHRRAALLFLDLDYFKHINDSLGHAVGDQVLQSVAQRLLSCVRGSDTVCRHGGDEFLVLLGEISSPWAVAQTAQKLLQAVAAPHLLAAHQLQLTLSIGFSIYPDDGADVASLVKNADTAMYEAKRQGRNGYQRYSEQLDRSSTARPCAGSSPAGH